MSPLKIKRNKRKKIKKKKTILRATPQSVSLPNDLLLSCFSRISRLHYPNVSFVSKQFSSLLASPELYKARSLLGHTESCLYVCLRFAPGRKTRWFTLCMKPNQRTSNTIKNKKKRRKNYKKKESSRYVLTTLSFPHSPPVHSSSLVAAGFNIYNIGGSSEEAPSSSVSILDCRSNTWHEAPNMNMERFHHAANVHDGKIYVTGGCKEGNFLNWMEVFDIKTQTWEFILSPLADMFESKVFKSAVLDEKIYTSWYKNVVYVPKEYRWEEITGVFTLFSGWECDSYCVVDNILYCHRRLYGIIWYNSKLRYWSKLNGLYGLSPESFDGYVKLADYGGKMVVLWDRYLPRENTKKMISCAVIALDKYNLYGLWGKVEWLHDVLVVPKSYEFVCALSVTV